MKKINILHLASFNGNVGDNFNHFGFRPWFEKTLKKKVTWKELEIRQFYWKKIKWDMNFVNLVNSHDLLVIGGGNYFELWVKDSPTGTSISIPLKLFKKIKIPIYFNSLGVDIGMGISNLSKKRFITFIELILSNDQYILSVRNDGSKKNLKKILNNNLYKKIHMCPDHGFFIKRKSKKEKRTENKSIAINLACDMPKIRFKNFGSEKNKLNNFSEEMALFICKICKKYSDLKIILVPHIFSDLLIYNKILKFLPDNLRRTKIRVGEFGSGIDAANKVINYYLDADLVLGMRFHSNVTPIGLNKETIGLKNYPQIENLYYEVGQHQRILDVSKPRFHKKVFNKVNQIFSKNNRINKKPKDAFLKVNKQRNDFSKFLNSWLKKFF